MPAVLHPGPTGDLECRDEARTVTWVSGLFLATVLLQRLSVPGVPAVALLLPVVVGWSVCAVHAGVAVLDRSRALLWLAAFGATGVLFPLQAAVRPSEVPSLTSWGLFMVTWLPFVLRLRHRSTPVYVRVLRRVVVICGVLAAASVLMMLSQLAGLAYQDWMAQVVPAPFLLEGYVITYPVSFGSPLYRSNVFIGLEPSFVSAQIGLGVLAALLTGARTRVLLLLLAGLVCTVAGSGFAIVAVGVLVMALHRASGRLLLRHLRLAAAAAVLLVLTPFGQGIVGRVGEVGDSESSTSLRAVAPYRLLVPEWTSDLASVLVGRGAGSSQDLVELASRGGAAIGLGNLLVPSPAKVLFEYGLLGGLPLLLFLVYCYWAGPSRAVAVSLFASLFVLQPGTTNVLIVSPVLLLVALWSPRPGAVLESTGPPTARPVPPPVRRPSDRMST